MERKQNWQSGLSRRRLLKCGLYGGLAAGLSPGLFLEGCRRQRRRKKTNLIIISVDTLRADHVSCYGYKKPTTPNIDRLAMQGHRFSSAYTNMPTTLPAHASLLSSLYPRQLSVRRNGEKVPADAPMLAGVLQSAGYLTAAFVSAAVMNARYGLDQGFATYDDVGQQNARPAGKTLAKTTAWLESHSDDNFFIFVHLFDPHTPYYAPEFFRKGFGASAKPVPSHAAFVPDVRQFTADVVQKTIAAYDAEIAYADWAVGRLMNELVRLELDERTLVVLLSDHGESLDELITRFGYAFDHGEFLYTHQLEIPLVIRMPQGPSQAEPTVHAGPVSIIDVMPTVLDILDVKPPAYMAGRSLTPVLRGEKIPRQPVFSQRRTFETVPRSYLAGEDYSIIDGKWHLIFSSLKDRSGELYDLIADHRETSNLLGKHKKVEILQSLKGKLHSHLAGLKPLFGPSVFETDAEALEQLRSLGYAE